MVVHAINSRTWEAEKGGFFYKFGTTWSTEQVSEHARLSREILSGKIQAKPNESWRCISFFLHLVSVLDQCPALPLTSICDLEKVLS